MKKTINERVRFAREAAKLTQCELASRLNMSQSGYAHYEDGSRALKGDTIKQLCEILRVSPSYLLGVTDNPAPDSQTGVVSVPVYGSIAAGAPISSFEQDGSYEIPAKIAYKYPKAFLLKVEGESMNRILPNGCLALIDPCSDVEYQGKPYAISVNGDTATIKRVKKLANGFELIPDSDDPTYRIKVYDYGDDSTEEVSVVGKVVWYTLPAVWAF